MTKTLRLTLAKNSQTLHDVENGLILNVIVLTEFKITDMRKVAKRGAKGG